MPFITRFSFGVCAVLFVCVQLAEAQMSGRLEMTKTRYSAGEPIEIVFAAKNIGTKPLKIGIEDPYGRCSSYKVSGLTSKDSERKRSGPPVAKEFENVEQFDCLSSSKTLAPQEEYVEKFRLNETYDLSRPGKYHIEVTRVLPYGKKGVVPQGNWSLTTFRKSFEFSVD